MFEMHWLAYYYHWSEEKIECMPISKRRKWIEQIRKQKELEAKAYETGNSTPDTYQESS